MIIDMFSISHHTDSIASDYDIIRYGTFGSYVAGTHHHNLALVAVYDQSGYLWRKYTCRCGLETTRRGEKISAIR